MTCANCKLALASFLCLSAVALVYLPHINTFFLKFTARACTAPLHTPPATDLAEWIDEHAEKLHVDCAGHCARVSAVDEGVLLGTEHLGGCRALGAEIDGAVAACRTLTSPSEYICVRDI